MATSEILGLFTTPEQYQAIQNQNAYQQAVDTAKLTPSQAASASVGYGLYNLGKGIGGILGGQDPQLQLISQRQQLARMLDQNDPESYNKVANIAIQTGDPQFGMLLAQEGRKVEESLAAVNLKKAQAKKAEDWKQAQTDSAQKRQAIATLEEKLASNPDYKPTSTELAQARWIIANETKPKSMIDPASNQLLVIEGLNVNDAAPNLANYLKNAGVAVPTAQPVTDSTGAVTTPVATPTQPAPTQLPPGTTQVAPGIKAVATPGSSVKAKEEEEKQAAKLEEDTRAAENTANALANIKGVRRLITDTSNLVKPTTTGFTGKVLAIGSTEARVLENNNARIRNNAVFEELANLKSQSKTGSTGFGALNLEELRTIQNKAATLDPMSPNYKNDLADIDNYFARIEKITEARAGRAEQKVKNRQGVNVPLSSNDEATIKKFIEYNTKPNKLPPTREDAIKFLRDRNLIK